jgi:hypothetical protein
MCEDALERRICEISVRCMEFKSEIQEYGTYSSLVVDTWILPNVFNVIPKSDGPERIASLSTLARNIGLRGRYPRIREVAG